MSKSSDQPSTDNKTKQPNTQRRLALLAILLGLLVGVVFVYVFISSTSGAESSAVTSRSEDSASEQGNAVGADAVALLLSAEDFPEVSAKDLDHSGTQATVGHPAPNFAIQLADGSTTTLHDIAGRPILINFWATWCPPCRREMPDLIEAYETYKDEGLIVIEVNSAETAAQVADFVEQFNVTAPVVLDTRNEVMAIYRTNSLPASFFIDSDGVIQAHWPGFMDKDTIDELLEKIL